MTHLSLFTGIGGLDLAAEWAGFETVGQCEWADYPTKVLEKHWPDVPRWRDIRTLTKESFYVQTGMRTVEVISGGFPCQPFSVAGKRRGKEDDRYLWPEMLRVIQEIRPSWVVGENVAGIVNMALDQVLSDLENIGYTCQAFIIPACAIDAPHRRDRCAIVAHRESKRDWGISVQQRAARQTCFDTNRSSTDVAHTVGVRLRKDIHQSPSDAERDDPAHRKERGPELRKAGRRGGDVSNTDANGGWWPAEPGVGRVAHGVPSRVDRLKCLGNAVVPQQFYPVFRAIADVEEDRP